MNKFYTCFFFRQNLFLTFAIVVMVIEMKIYVDLVFFINFSYDFFLLITVSSLLKEWVPLKKIFLGAFLGGISIFFLFLSMNEITLFVVKIIISIFMILATFSYQNKEMFFKNIGTLYLSSFFLGGILYFFKDTFYYQKQGLLFLYQGTSPHFLLIILLGPFFLFFYRKQLKKEKRNLTLVHSLYFEALGKTFKIEGFLDTGNQLQDPFKKRSIILLYEKGFLPKIEEAILVPFETARGGGLVRCVIPKILTVDGKEMHNYLIGFLDKKIAVDGRSCLLPNQMREELE